jgi:methyl-accepting chemotaxis protein-1 (serine sensor receptor)
MGDIVKAAHEVNAIVAEISAASDFQSQGIEEIERAVSHMDRSTQQNAALVEQAASAAASLEEQARLLDETVAVFRLRADALASTTRERPAPVGMLPAHSLAHE